jgi:hypothetical protein
MKKNRMSKKNRKMIHNTLAFKRRKETQKHQRLARENGVFSPRKLARSVGIFVGMVTDEINPKEAAFNWKAYVEAVIKHPKEFHAMMNPKKDIRDSSGTVSRVIRKVKA